VLSAPDRLLRLPSGLNLCGNLLNSLEIFVGRAPEEKACGDLANRHRGAELCGETDDAILHRLMPFGGARMRPCCPEIGFSL
jgi:hypothetical protein